MIVCHCHSVTDRAIRDAVRCGARTACDVGDACGAGTGCGGCRDLVELIVDREGGHHPVATTRPADAFAEAG